MTRVVRKAKAVLLRTAAAILEIVVAAVTLLIAVMSPAPGRRRVYGT